MRTWATALVAALLALMFASASGAAAGGPGPPLAAACHAEASAAERLTDIAADVARWRCDGTEPSLRAEQSLLRFTVPMASEARVFATRPSLFQAIELAVVRDGRVVAAGRYAAWDLPTGPHGRMMQVALPTTAVAGDAVIVSLHAPTTRALFSDARLHPSDPTDGESARAALLLAAVVCGMLLMPLAFNVAYYRVLRERFVLWHLALSLALLLQCLLSSGIATHLVPIPVPLRAVLGTLTFGIGVALAAAFCAAFIEPRKLDPRLRRALYASAVWIALCTVLHAAFPYVGRGFQTPVYYACFAPALVVFCAVMADAWRRGSRAVRYQAVGWAPFVTVGLIRLVTMLYPGAAQNEAMGLFYLAMVLEAVATSLGVADRFMMIKRQRDRALNRANSLERLSERDDLTGLYNRRALDGRLGHFSIQRFTGFALFDLDNFKRVNDTQGHAVGDAVLRTVAGVLDTHPDAVALRMGGEEFLLLLRGDNVAERVERLREAIPVRIAREVAALELLVTASAGLVEAMPGADIGSDFTALYRQADSLLYEAKHNGRNLLASATLRPGTGGAAAGSAVAAA
jgi:diguanylate cyclase (GGDEF)-like protein